MRRCGIYLIENIVSPLFYIGQTINIRARWNAHRYLLRVGGNTNRRLRHSWEKHGPDAFRFSVLEECASEDLTERETHWIEVYRSIHPGLVANSAGPVDNPTKGVPMSSERRARMSVERKGKPNPNIAGDRNPSRRPEFRQRISGEGNPAKRPEVRQKMSEVRVNWVEDLDTGERWRTMSECAEALGVSVAAVSAAVARNGTCAGRTIRRWFNARLHAAAMRLASAAGKDSRP